MPVVLIQPHYISKPGVAARPGAGRPYERNKYPQTTPVSRRKTFSSLFSKKTWKSLRILVRGWTSPRECLPFLLCKDSIVDQVLFYPLDLVRYIGLPGPSMALLLDQVQYIKMDLVQKHLGPGPTACVSWERWVSKIGDLSHNNGLGKC